MPTRALWTGSLSFGLLRIPVALHSNEKRKEPEFNLLDRRDHAPVGTLRVNKRNGEEVSDEDIVRSYKLTAGDYLVVPEEEIKKASPEFTRDIRILSFVVPDEIKPVYFETPYYLEPTVEGEKGYALLLDALARARKAGIARVVIRHRERMAALIPDGSILVLNTLRFADELRHPKRLDQPEPDLEALGVAAKEQEMAHRLVKEMTSAWDPMSYRDEFREKLLAYIRQKSAVDAGEAAPESVQEASKPPSKGKMLPLLEQSLSDAAEARRRRGKIA